MFEGREIMFEGLEIMLDGHEIMVDVHEIMFEGMYSMPFEHIINIFKHICRFRVQIILL